MASVQDPRGLQIIDPVLTNLAISYHNPELVYDQLVAVQDVALNAGQYPVWTSADFLRDEGSHPIDQRAETPEVDIGYSLKDYALKDYRLKVSITNEERQQANPALRLEQAKLNKLRLAMSLSRERRLAAKLRKTTNGGELTLGATPSVKWDAASGVVIEQNIKAARKAVYDQTGQHVDTIVLSWDVAYTIALDPSIREIIKYTGDGGLIIRNGEALLPRTLHGLNVIVVNGDKYNSAREGAAQTLSSIWSDNAILLKRGRDNEWGEPATVYCLRGRVAGAPEGAARQGPTGANPGFALVDRWAIADPPVEYIRAWEKVDEKVVAPDVAYEISDVLT